MGRAVLLNVKSEYNFNSLIKVEELLKKCKKEGMPAVALADSHRMIHLIDFIEKSKQYNVKPLFACEINLVLSEKLTVKTNIYAKNFQGYKHLIKISSYASMRNSGKDPFVKKEEFEQLNGHLIATVDLYPFLNENPEEADQVIAYFQNRVENFYVKIESDGTEQSNQINQVLLAYCQGKKVSMVAANEVLYLEKSEVIHHRVLQAIRESKELTEIKEEAKGFQTEQELKALFHACPEALKNTEEIQKLCNVTIPLKGEKGFTEKNPHFQVPEDFAYNVLDLRGKFDILKGFQKPKNEEEKRKIAYLCYLVWDGFSKFYHAENHEAAKRLSYELGVIISKGFVDYFLIVHDFIQYALRTNIALGPGRGSVMGSLLARCLRITSQDICPLVFGLQFERFLNVEREDKTDIDIDMSQKDRPLMIRYAKEKYGSNNVAQILTFKNFGLKDGIKAIGKVLKMEQSLVENMLKYADENTKTVEQLLVNLKGSEMEQVVKKSEEAKQVLHLVLVIQTLPHSLSRHAAGIIITKQEVSEDVPVMVMKDKDTGEDVLVTQIPNNNLQLEKAGCTKIDFLGSRNADVLKKVEELRTNGKNAAGPVGIPKDDPEVMKLYQRGETVGVFQMDSYGMRQAAKQVQPQNFKDIISLIALFRPGSMEMIPKFAENKRKNNAILFDLTGQPLQGVDELRPIVEDTYGVIVYQEQINAIVSLWAGFSFGEADLLRRAISKKKKEVMGQQRDLFLKKANDLQRDPATSIKLFDVIERFADYGFNRAHATVYALVSYYTAWFKTHYPKEYMSVLLSSVTDAKDKLSYLEETKRMGISIDPPDINASESTFSLTDKGIVYGISMIKNIGQKAAEAIEQERKKGPFLSFEQFIERTHEKAIDKKVITTLIQVGAFDTFGKRTHMLEKLDYANKQSTPKPSLSFGSIPFIDSDVRYPFDESAAEYSLADKIKWEKQLAFTQFSFMDSSKLDASLRAAWQKRKMENRMLTGGVVVDIQKRKTKKGAPICFIKIAFEGKTKELVCYEQEWEKAKNQIALFEPFLFEIKDNGQKNPNIKAVIPVQKEIEVVLTLSTEDFQEKWGDILSVIKQFPGEMPLVLSLDGQERKTKFTVSPEAGLKETLQERGIMVNTNEKDA